MWSSATLQFLSLFLLTVARTSSNARNGDDTQIVPELVQIIDVAAKIPEKIVTARKHMGIYPVYTTYAVCPSRTCSQLYPGEEIKKGVLRYPARCKGNRFSLSDTPCKARLTKAAKHNGEAIRVPKKTFQVQSLDSFVANMLMRKGMQSILFEGMKRFERAGTTSELSDITDSPYIRNLPAADGTPFMSTTTGDLRLAWILSIDWFCPFSKSVGKHASVGSVVLSCANLPPDLRNKPENQLVIGVIPGPFEPTAEEMNNYLAPIVDMLLKSWTHGTYYGRTPESAGGLLSRSILAILVADLLAAKKCAGFAPHNANSFCSICTMKKSERNDVKVYQKAWKDRTRNLETHKVHANEWLNAKSARDRKDALSGNGVRWSELLRLPYWDPTKAVVVDGMHNLFLGLVATHVKVFLGLNHESNSKKKSEPKNKKTKKHNKTNTTTTTAAEEAMAAAEKPTKTAEEPTAAADGTVSRPSSEPISVPLARLSTKAAKATKATKASGQKVIVAFSRLIFYSERHLVAGERNIFLHS